MHDANGESLKVGDEVAIPCKIVDLSSDDVFLCRLTTLTSRRPNGVKDMAWVNTGLVVKMHTDYFNVHRIFSFFCSLFRRKHR